WPDTARGRRGVGQATEIGLIVPLDRIGYWVQRFLERGVRFRGPTPDGDRTLLELEDPDGLPVALVGTPDAPVAFPWEGSDVPAEASVRGLHHVTLWSDVPDATGRILTDHLGFAHVGTDEAVRRYRSDAPVGHTVLVRDAHSFWPSAGGVGTLHHVAFRTADNATHERLADRLGAEDLELNPLREHGFFRSLYVREPGGAILEVATDGPGLAAGQPPERLGLDLVLSEELEPKRALIEVVLPHVAAPGEPRPPKRDLGWVHRFVPGSGRPTLMLLHGSGGNETSSLAFAREAAPADHLLAVRGRSLEEGAPRFLRRHEHGVDQEQLAAEAGAIAVLKGDAADVYGFDPGAAIALW
ncbi:MAG: VOC family protein, partial [Acidimicrobiia bacterium]